MWAGPWAWVFLHPTLNWSWFLSMVLWSGLCQWPAFLGRQDGPLCNLATFPVQLQALILIKLLEVHSVQYNAIVVAIVEFGLAWTLKPFLRFCLLLGSICSHGECGFKWKSCASLVFVVNEILSSCAWPLFNCRCRWPLYITADYVFLFPLVTRSWKSRTIQFWRQPGLVGRIPA